MIKPKGINLVNHVLSLAVERLAPLAQHLWKLPALKKEEETIKSEGTKNLDKFQSEVHSPKITELADASEDDILSEASTGSSDSLSETSSESSDSLSHSERSSWPLKSSQSHFLYNKAQVEERKSQIDRYLTSLSRVR